MSNEAEMDKVLDAMEEQLLPDDQVEEDIVDEIIDEEIEVDAEEKPPGFMDYEQWVAAGKDPRKFRGEEAYKAHYVSLQEIRALKDNVTSIADGMAAWKAQQLKQEEERVAAAVEAAKAKLAQAEEDEDVAGALAAEREINALKAKAKSVEESPEYKPNPIIADFAAKNPIIDKNSPQYDAEFYSDMAMMQGTILDKLTGGIPEKIQALTPSQIQRSLDLAYREAKALHPDKFVSQKNTRRTAAPAPKKKQASTGDVRAKLKGLGGGGLNKNDANPALDMYDMLKGIDPAQAEQFAAKVLGE